ncbi:hypothetical protein F4801DRAFT_574884 [Xylaria longipes]|nr:hypothetical protein F4801DRAFT_574884 [Xylaria longipes]
MKRLTHVETNLRKSKWLGEKRCRRNHRIPCKARLMHILYIITVAIITHYPEFSISRVACMPSSSECIPPEYYDADWGIIESDGLFLSVQGAGIRVFRLRVPLDIPSGADVSISFRLTAPFEATLASGTGKINELWTLLFAN